MYRGELEIHVTADAWSDDRLDAFAAQRGVKVSHIELDHGVTTSQPMLTVELSGTLEYAQARADELCAELGTARVRPVRVKIEAAPWNKDVPVQDADAREGLYFEHHVKLLLPADDVTRRIAASVLARKHDARLSRNARRRRDDGTQERFMTQRCFGVGRSTSRARLDTLLAALGDGGFEVLEVEEEYVVGDDNLGLDAGWMDRPMPSSTTTGPTLPSPHDRNDQRMRTQLERGAGGFPATFVPPVDEGAVVQHAVFEPAHKHFPNAFKTGRPVFGDPARDATWGRARAEAQAHVLRTISSTPWAGRLVMRGSATLPVWLGDAARTPGDIDFVVVPATAKAADPAAAKLLDGVLAALAADPGPGLRAEDAAREEIWTYERAEGRRLVVPYDVAERDLPDGYIQLDFVFGEELPAAPVRAVLPHAGAEMLVAPPDLQLAWKILWLATDFYPQGKDLYDAVLLAGVTKLSRDLLDQVFASAENPWDTSRLEAFTPATLLELDVDWENFQAEHPGIQGDVRDLLERLVLALHRSTGNG